MEITTLLEIAVNSKLEFRNLQSARISKDIFIYTHGQIVKFYRNGGNGGEEKAIIPRRGSFKYRMDNLSVASVNVN